MATLTINQPENDKLPRIFIGSSREALDIANSIQVALDYCSEPTVWTQGIFNFSSYTLDDLIQQFSSSDFAIFVFTPDDVSIIRTEEQKTVRDNVLFEFGLSIGIIGKERVFAIQPRNSNQHLPSDLKGLTMAVYNPDRSDKNLIAAISPAVTEIKNQINKIKNKIPPRIEVEVGPVDSSYGEFEILHPFGDIVNTSLFQMDGQNVVWTPKCLPGKVVGFNTGAFRSEKFKVVISPK